MDKNIKQQIATTFRAFNSRNYRLFFFGQCISLIGTWLQNVAIGWLLYSLTKSALMMGYVLFVVTLPPIFLSPFAGVVVDRVQKHKLLILIQFLFGIQAFAMAVLTLSGAIQTWHVVFLGILLSLIVAFDMPTRQALVVELVDNHEDLSNAISLNSTCFNFARLLGPAIAGVLIAAVGEGYCFLINALSYIAVIWALFLMKIPKKELRIKNQKPIEDFKEGFKYVLEMPEIKYVIIFLALITSIGLSYQLLMPILCKEILDGGAKTMGFLMSSAGVGALIASLILASKEGIKGLPRMLFKGGLILSLGLCGLGLNHNSIVAMILLFLVGYGIVSSLIIANTLVQHVVDDDKRGRVMSLYSIAFIGTVPFGNLFLGAMADKIGVLNTFLFLGIAMIIASYWFVQKLKHLKFKAQKRVFIQNIES
ncbi:MAG: MFS transporter [Candidatus Gastranaerophilales bacterium]|nr:MFS transporter [Candidatus Gastranaerophilales bacterium]